MANAKIAGDTLAGLAGSAERIVVARVVRLHTVGQLRVAEATVERRIKGEAAAGPIYFVASPTWTCDCSEAVSGERALLFLVKARSDEVGMKGSSARVKVPQEPLYYLAMSGRGRMPLRTVREQHRVVAALCIEPGRGGADSGRTALVALEAAQRAAAGLDRHAQALRRALAIDAARHQRAEALRAPRASCDRAHARALAQA